MHRFKGSHMRNRHLWSGPSVACVAALVSTMVAPLSGQSAPRTPWGDGLKNILSAARAEEKQK